jgi:uncharacterized membrane protein
MHRRARFFALALAASIAAGPAWAEFKICNRTSYVVYAATAAMVGSKATVHGWTRMIPGDCETAIKGDLAAEAYFVYARTSRAHAGPQRAWGGAVPFCTREADFTLQMPMRATCKGADVSALPFAGVDTHRVKAWTMTLTESPALASFDAARIAGLKRLLHDNGLKTGPFDARPDKDAAASLGKYRARRPLAVTAHANDLFNLMEVDALKEQALAKPAQKTQPAMSK